MRENTLWPDISRRVCRGQFRWAEASAKYFSRRTRPTEVPLGGAAAKNGLYLIRGLRGFFDRLAAALTRTNGRTPPERRYRPGARWSRTSANTQHDTWYTNIRRRTSQQNENDDGYKKQHTRLPKTGCAAITEMHILFKHGFQISAKGRGQLFDVSAGGIHKKVVVFPRTPFLLTEESVILCTAAVDLRNPFLHLRFC